MAACLCACVYGKAVFSGWTFFLWGCLLLEEEQLYLPHCVLQMCSSTRPHAHASHTYAHAHIRAHAAPRCIFPPNKYTHLIGRFKEPERSVSVKAHPTTSTLNLRCRNLALSGFVQRSLKRCCCQPPRRRVHDTDLLKTCADQWNSPSGDVKKEWRNFWLNDTFSFPFSVWTEEQPNDFWDLFLHQVVIDRLVAMSDITVSLWSFCGSLFCADFWALTSMVSSRVYFLNSLSMICSLFQVARDGVSMQSQSTQAGLLQVHWTTITHNPFHIIHSISATSFSSGIFY